MAPNITGTLYYYPIIIFLEISFSDWDPFSHLRGFLSSWIGIFEDVLITTTLGYVSTPSQYCDDRSILRLSSIQLLLLRNFIFSTMIFRTSLAFSILCFVIPVTALYDPSGPVLLLNPRTFDQKIRNSNHSSMVEFFAPWFSPFKT